MKKELYNLKTKILRSKHISSQLKEELANDVFEIEKLASKNNLLHSVSHCPLCGSDDLFQYKLQHIHCQKCYKSFNKGCD